MKFTSPLPPDDAPLLEWALWYASHGVPVFPCYGKQPLGIAVKHGHKEATCETTTIRSWWGQWPQANIGIPVQDGEFILDEDPRKGGDTTLYLLQQHHGVLPDTLTTHTGGDGRHLKFTSTVPVKNKANIGDGIDVQGVGSYVIVPPSIHPETGKRYVWDVVYGPDSITPQPAPVWLEDLIRKETEDPEDPEDPTEAGARDAQAPILEGRRETTLMQLAGAMQRVGASPEAIRRALEEENRRCVPPLTGADLDRMTRSVGRYAPAARLEVGGGKALSRAGGAWDGSRAATATPWDVCWTSALVCNARGIPSQIIYNLGVILDHHPHWQQPENRLWYDDAHGEYLLGEQVLSEEDVTRIGEWITQETGMPVTNDAMVNKALNVRCKGNTRDLLREEVNALPPWDGVERLEYWMSDYAGTERTAYGVAVSRLLPVSMIARALDPGCQYRYVVVLCGLENTGKSKLLRHLASPAWYIELSCSLEGKEAHILLRGIWLAEFSELESLGRTGENRLKSYISMQQDAYVPKFSNRRVHVPRRTIFVGTTNEDEFLKGQSGNTRYLPITCGEMDPDGLLPVRDQLLAEARVYYLDHLQDWWQLGEEAESQAVEEREARREKSVYEDLLASTLLDYAHVEHSAGGHTTYMVWWDLIAEHLGILPERRTQRIRHEVGMALRALKWTYSPHRERLTFQGKALRVRPWRLIV